MGCLGSKEAPVRTDTPKKHTTYTVRLLGELGVGKSSLLMAWAEGSFSGQPIPTVGDEEHRSKDVTVNGNPITLDVVDSAGQERYLVITSSQFRHVDGFFLCFDLAKRESFQKVENWIEQVEKYCNKAAPQLLVGLKSDLDRVVTSEEAAAWASLHGLRYLEASSKTLSNIDLVFLTMAQIVDEAEERAREEA